MEVLKANNLVVRLKKCTFCQSSVAYLGHVISHKGVTTDPSKVEAIRNRKTPQNVTELKEFLRMAGYYRRFIKDYGSICKPLYNMLKKDGFKWGSEQDTAFDCLKHKLCDSPVLALPDFS